jgi:predicted transcriptional regulator of viral defense system
MAKKLNPILVQNELSRKKIFIFTPLEFERLFGVSSKAATSFIFDHTRKNLFSKLRNGLYALTSNLPSELLIANKLYQPSYISLEYALSYHHLIPETVYTITSATTKPTREFEALDKIYHYYKIKREAFLGYEPKRVDGVTVLIAEPEKALVDYLYFVSLKKRVLNERLTTRNLNKKKVLEYAEAFKREGLRRLMEKIL